jgi:hypothetical protein
MRPVTLITGASAGIGAELELRSRRTKPGNRPLISRRATAIKWSVTQSMCQFDWKFCGSPAWCQAALTKSPSDSS